MSLSTLDAGDTRVTQIINSFTHSPVSETRLLLRRQTHCEQEEEVDRSLLLWNDGRAFKVKLKSIYYSTASK